MQQNNNTSPALDSSSIQITSMNYWGPYILSSKINEGFAKNLLDAGKELTITSDNKKRLASRIDKVRSYKDEPWISNGLLPYVNAWVEGWKKFSSRDFTPKNAQLTAVWINFQEAGEINPEHIHGDSDLSFVIYLEIPSEIILEYERFMYDRMHRGCPPGSIFFNYGEYNRFAVGGRNICPRENMLLMWPSYLRHGVSPFEANSTRISVAGNIVFLD